MLSPAEFQTYIYNLIGTSPLSPYVQIPYYSDQVILLLKGTSCTYGGYPDVDWDYLALENGILNLKTKEFQKFNEKIFLTSKVSYSYNPDARCPNFLNFLKEMTGGYQDRIDLLRS